MKPEGRAGRSSRYRKASASSAELKADLTALRGRVALPESTSGGWGDRGAAPMRDWRVERLGADPPEALVKLREDIERAVLAACGVPAGIVSTISDGTHARESFRQFVALTIKPLSLKVAENIRGSARPARRVFL